MRPMFFTVEPNTPSVNAIFLSQTTAAPNDNLLLNGSESSNNEWASADSLPKKVSITSAGNVATVTFTIQGFADIDRNIAVTDTITGVNASTVLSTEYFAVITTITADLVVAIPVEGGTTQEVSTPIIPLNWRGQIVGFTVTVTGTVDYTVQQTQNDIQNEPLPFSWNNNDDTDLVNATTTLNGNYFAIPLAMRVILNSYTPGTGSKIDLTVTHTDAN